MNNFDLSRQLARLANYLYIAGDESHTAALYAAVHTVSRLPGASVAESAKSGSTDPLSDLAPDWRGGLPGQAAQTADLDAGAGSANAAGDADRAFVAHAISEILETGQSHILAQPIDDIPLTVVELAEVPALGAKRARRIWKQYSIASLDELDQALRSRRLADMEGAGPKMLEAIRVYIEQTREAARVGSAS